MLYLALLIFFSLLSPGTAFAEKPQSPLELSRFFTEVVALEDAYSEGDWEFAKRSFAELHETLGKLAPTLEEHAGEKLTTALLAKSVALGTAIAQQDRSRATQGLIAVQDALFRVMDVFDYMVHPVVLIIDRYVGEALEAVERKDFSRVAHELEEVSSFLSKGAEILAEKGVGAGMQRDFRQQIELAEAAAKRSDQALTAGELQRVKKLSRTFVWMATH